MHEGMVVGMLWRTSSTTYTSGWRLIAGQIRERMALSAGCLHWSRGSEVVSVTVISCMFWDGVNRTLAANTLGRRAFMCSHRTKSISANRMGVLSLLMMSGQWCLDGPAGVELVVFLVGAMLWAGLEETEAHECWGTPAGGAGGCRGCEWP